MPTIEEALAARAKKKKKFKKEALRPYNLDPHIDVKSNKNEKRSKNIKRTEEEQLDNNTRTVREQTENNEESKGEQLEINKGTVRKQQENSKKTKTDKKESSKGVVRKQLEYNKRTVGEQKAQGKTFTREQSENNKETIGEHKENSKRTNDELLPSKNFETKRRTRLLNNAIFEVQKLCGMQEQLLILIAKKCVENGNNNTGPITNAYIANSINISIYSVKESIKRLINKGVLRREEGKKGPGGFSNFSLTEEIISAVVSLFLSENKK